MRLVKIIKVGLISFLLLLLINPVKAQDKVTIYFFWSETCPHCAQEKVFLENLDNTHPGIEIKSYKVNQPEAIQLLQIAKKTLNADLRWVPLTIIGNQQIIGFESPDTTGLLINKAVEKAQQENYPDIFQAAASTKTPPHSSDSSSLIKPVSETINIPLLGQVKIRNLSLPALTVLLGVLDGFNPCAMWALLFLISLLLSMKDRNRMWVLGTTFIVTSAFVYFLFISAWLNLFLFLGFILWVKIIVGLIALIAGSYNLREYFINKDAVCKVTQGKKRQAIFARLKKITQKKDFFLALGGIVFLAFVINLVELVCSAGLPAIYTQVLTLSNLPTWQYYGYLLIYIFFFMIDDLFIFFAAMKTLKMVGIESKYAHYSHLIGGLIMLFIGLLMIFRPELLIFGSS